MQEFKEVKFETRDRIAWITLNRPQKLNSYTDHTLVELVEIWKEVDQNPEILVAILTGEGRAFCAGHDMGELKDLNEEPPSLHYRTIELYKPLLAAVNGTALGGGASLAWAADIRIASEKASFGYPQPAKGFMSVGGHNWLPRMTFRGKAYAMMLTGEIIDAQEAYRVGLVEKVVPHDQLIPETEKMAQKICANAPLAVRYTKEAMLRAERVPFNEGIRLANLFFARLLATEDAKEGVKSFQEKRAPVWKER